MDTYARGEALSCATLHTVIGPSEALPGVSSALVMAERLESPPDPRRAEHALSVVHDYRRVVADAQCVRCRCKSRLCMKWLASDSASVLGALGPEPCAGSPLQELTYGVGPLSKGRLKVRRCYNVLRCCRVPAQQQWGASKDASSKARHTLASERRSTPRAAGLKPAPVLYSAQLSGFSEGSGGQRWGQAERGSQGDWRF
jgi:hypothetical protein